MTSLLVSVRSAAEATAALTGGAAVIDVKDPDRGALGRAEPSVWKEVAQAVRGRAPLSVALGELADLITCEEPFAWNDTPEIAWAKLGLAGCGNMDWAKAWREHIARLPLGAQPVAVIYADWKSALAPSPEAVLHEASAQSCAALLIDTFSKTGGSLFDWMPPKEVAQLFTAAKQAGMRAAAAGSLTSSLLGAAMECGADIVAVRGAACEGSRTSAVSQRLVSELVTAVDRIDRSLGLPENESFLENSA